MRLALICPPFPSRVQVFGTLARALQSRGHEAVLILQEGAEAFLSSHARYVLVPPPPGLTTQVLLQRAARPGGVFGVLRTVAAVLRRPTTCAGICRRSCFVKGLTLSSPTRWSLPEGWSPAIFGFRTFPLRAPCLWNGMRGSHRHISIGPTRRTNRELGETAAGRWFRDCS